MTSISKSLMSLALVLTLQGAVALADSDRPLTKTKFDPSARQVEMFAGMEQGEIEVKLVARDSTGGNLFISNKTSEPLTVMAPAGFAAVPVSAQFGGGGMGMGGMGGMGMSGGMGGMSGGMGGGGMQSMGGGMGGGGMGGMSGGMGGGGIGMGGGGMSGGFFSIPAEKTLRVPFNSVCLNHGLKEPTSRAQFRVVRVEEYTNDPVLQSLIYMVGTGKLDQRSAQAATWHVTDGLTWEQLALKGNGPTRVPGNVFFSPQQIQAGMQIASMAQADAVERVSKDPSILERAKQPVAPKAPVRAPLK